MNLIKRMWRQWKLNRSTYGTSTTEYIKPIAAKVELEVDYWSTGLSGEYITEVKTESGKARYHNRITDSGIIIKKEN